MVETILEIALQVLALALKWVGAKDATLAAFESLVIASHNDGLISVNTRDTFIAQKQDIENALDKIK